MPKALQSNAASLGPEQVEIEEEEVVDGEPVDELMEVEDQEGYTSSTPTSTLTWISWFCSLPGHEYFCDVTEDFIEDDFNLTGLNTMVPFWKEAMEMVLDVEPDEDLTKIPDVSIVEASAELLYGLVHARYILTRAGLQAMVEKFENGVFGTCPRVYCGSSHVVPCGRSDTPGIDTVKLYCPNCHDIYNPPSSRYQGVDGAFFGSTFAHLFFQTYKELAPAPFWNPNPHPQSSISSSPAAGRASKGANGTQSGSEGKAAAFVNPIRHGSQKQAAGRVYVPRIYGFKVSERARSGPRMQWTRLRPEEPEELDYVDWRGRWINDDDYEEDEEDDGGPTGPMEDFDPDHGEDDDEEESESEEEEEGQRMPVDPRAAGGRRHAAHIPGQLPGKVAPPSSKPSSQAAATSSTINATNLPPSFLDKVDAPRLMAVRQWTATRA